MKKKRGKVDETCSSEMLRTIGWATVQQEKEEKNNSYLRDTDIINACRTLNLIRPTIESNMKFI